LWCFFFWDRVLSIICPGLASNLDTLDLCLLSARITGLSHHGQLLHDCVHFVHSAPAHVYLKLITHLFSFPSFSTYLSLLFFLSDPADARHITVF
jgi:hypothetical protein